MRLSIATAQGLHFSESSVYLHLRVFPSRAAAEGARSPTGIVVEEDGRVWLGHPRRCQATDNSIGLAAPGTLRGRTWLANLWKFAKMDARQGIRSRCRSAVSDGTAQCQLASASKVDGARENPRGFLRRVEPHRVFGFDEIGIELRLPLVVAG